MSLFGNFQRLLHGATAVLLAGVLLGCASPPAPTADGRVYHCVGGAVPVPPPDTWGKKYTTEAFTYAEYKIDESTIAKGILGHSRCGEYSVPKTAYLRYQVDGRVLEKRFDLSALSARRVRGKTVLFFVDGETVEVRLLTTVDGALPSKEVIDLR